MEKLPAIGTLTDRVQFRRRENIGGTDTFVPVVTMWARVRSVTKRENGVTHLVVIRYRTDVNVADQFVCRGRTLTVVTADDLDGRRSYLRIEASEPTP